MIFDGQMPDDWNSGDHTSSTVTVNGEVVDSSELDELLPPQAREMLMQQGVSTYRDLVNKAMASEDQQSEHVEMFIDLHSHEHENPEPADHPTLLFCPHRTPHQSPSVLCVEYRRGSLLRSI